MKRLALLATLLTIGCGSLPTAPTPAPPGPAVNAKSEPIAFVAGAPLSLDTATGCFTAPADVAGQPSGFSTLSSPSGKSLVGEQWLRAFWMVGEVRMQNGWEVQSSILAEFKLQDGEWKLCSWQNATREMHVCSLTSC